MGWEKPTLEENVENLAEKLDDLNDLIETIFLFYNPNQTISESRYDGHQISPLTEQDKEVMTRLAQQKSDANQNTHLWSGTKAGGKD